MALLTPAFFLLLWCPTLGALAPALSSFPAASFSFGAKAAPSFAAPSFASPSFAAPSFAASSTTFAPASATFGGTVAATNSLPLFPTTWNLGAPLTTFGKSKPLISASTQKTDAATLAKLTNEDDLSLLDKSGLESTERLYDQGSFRNWNIQMAQKDIDAMNANPTSETKFPCSITSAYGSRTAKTFVIPSLSCRYKGSVGSLRMCVDERGAFNGDCRKLSWAVDVEGIKLPKSSVATKGETSIHGAKNFIFGGCPVDWSMMSERMAYSLLNAVNVTAPVAAHAKLFLNGKYLGVYSFVQPVDPTFTRERFLGDKNMGRGALYKQVWFNELGMKDLTDERKGGTAEDDAYMRTIMAAIDSTPLTKDAAVAMFAKYFDTKAFIDVTALNSVIGATDDWRQRHNFLWYVRNGQTGKKVVLLPWDYDRLYDEQALSRGALAGNPWWDIQASAQPSRCNAPLQTPEQLGAESATSPGEIARWTAIFKTLPADNQIPVTCDKITKLLSLAVGAQVRARTKEFLKLITLDQIRSWFSTWNQQIELALAYDPDGPNTSKMLDEQNKLLSHLTAARTLALNQANLGDRSSSSSPIFTMFRSG